MPLMSPASDGSSPLTRGKPLNHGLQRLVDGLIPAHAGKTIPLMLSRRSMRAHPRSRGENLPAGGGPHQAGGSSPLTRGKREDFVDYPCFERLIPAHAGKTVAARRTCATTLAHPRSRGENLVALRSGMIFKGSSPLTRGKLAGAR